MRVLAATPNYPPGSRVGAWLATHQFMRHLVQRGHEVTVFSAGSRRPGYVLDGVTVETMLRGRSRGAHLARAADVVVSHCGDGGVGADLAESAGVKSVRMAHGWNVRDIGDAHLVVFNSEHLRSSTGWSGRSIVCRPPVHAAEHRVAQIGDRVTIVNLSKPKGIMTAWRAAERCNRPFLGVRGGYGVQEIPRTGDWTVLPTQTDMRAVWSQTRVLLMPSAYEAWGMVGVEAMCSGIPVIAHPTPGLRESLGDAGIFADRDDTDAWLAALDRLDDPAEYATAAARARARADQLDPTSDLDRFCDALEGLCE